MRTRIPVALLLACSFCAAEDPKPSKGTQIGQTINDAITAALPGTKLIFDAVKALLPQGGDKVKRSDVEAAVQKAAEKARDAAINESNAQLGRLSGVLTEIEMTTELGDNARLAGANLLVIRSRLANRLDDSGWEQVKNEWNALAKKSVANVVAFDQKKLDQISDPDVQKELATFKKNSDRDIAEFERQIVAKDKAQALSFLLQIADRLDNVSSAPAVQLKSFGAQLASLSRGAQKSSPNQPPPPPPPPQPSPLTLLLREANANFK